VGAKISVGGAILAHQTGLLRYRSSRLDGNAKSSDDFGKVVVAQRESPSNIYVSGDVRLGVIRRMLSVRAAIPSHAIYATRAP
jgi:hypothetical protein